MTIIDGLRQADTERRAAIVDGDANATSQYLADDLTWTHSSGKTDSKESFLAILRSGATVYHSLDVRDTQARQFGELCVMEGVIFADRMELAFKGVGKRQFSYEFKMMPRSQAEADQIKQIIYAFKFNMLPSFEGDTKGRKMTVPNTFDIQYMYQNAENSYLNKVSIYAYLKDKFLKSIINYLKFKGSLQ